MKAKDLRRYIDKEKKILKTPNNLYQDSLSLMSDAMLVQKTRGLDAAKEGYKVIEDNLSEALLFGKAEAASGLAYLHRGGLGVEKSEHNYKLFITIGDKLGDPACKKMAEGNNFSDVEQEANAWVKTIKEIEKKYPNKDEEITATRLIESRDKLNEAIKNSDETHYYIDKEHTILRTADDLYKDCMENLKQVKSTIGEKRDLTSDKLVKSFCSNAMLSFMNGKVDAAEFLIYAYNQIKEYPTYQKSQEIDGSIEILCATSNMLGGRGGIHKAYKAFEKKDAKYKSSIEQKAEDLDKHIKMQDPRAEITDKMVIEANNIYYLFFPDPITQQFSSDFVVKDSYQDTTQFYPPVVALQVSDYQDPYHKNDHNELKVSGEGSSSCCNIL